jgi:hypothetical protein
MTIAMIAVAAVIVLALAIVVGLTVRHHFGGGSLKHREVAPQSLVQLRSTRLALKPSWFFDATRGRLKGAGYPGIYLSATEPPVSSDFKGGDRASFQQTIGGSTSLSRFDFT